MSPYADKVKRLEASRRSHSRHPEIRKRWAERNPEKRKAQVAVGNALRDGRLQRQPCEVCGTELRVQAHHDNYDRPLEVRWLCTAHHAEVHHARGEAA